MATKGLKPLYLTGDAKADLRAMQPEAACYCEDGILEAVEDGEIVDYACPDCAAGRRRAK